jgi:hypothetical protein
MEQLRRLGLPTQQPPPASTDEEPHQHPLVTHGRGGSQVEKKKPRITPGQIFSNYKHASPKGAA